MSDNLKYLFIVLFAIFLDQVTKLLIIDNLTLYSSINIIPGFFDITHIHNPGGAFGFFAGKSHLVRKFVFIGIAFMALFVILWFFKTTPKEFLWLRISYAMIFGGAVGNIIDRVRFGYVVDFLDIYLKNMHWPAFNIADSFITVGMGIIIFHVLFNKVP